MVTIPLPDDRRPIRSIFTHKLGEKIDNGKGHWGYGKHSILKDGKVVFEYERNYPSFYNTFEPFRQFKGGAWHNYALISPKYSTFSVVDLDKGEIVATRPYPVRVVEDDWPEQMPSSFKEGAWLHGKKPGDTFPGEGFCPMDFYVPDIFEEEYDTLEDLAAMEAEDYQEELKAYARGAWGFVGGCIWGDDSSTKLRYIDLTKISSGEVKEEERFGYWELPEGKSIRESVALWEQGMSIATKVFVSFRTGKASSYSRNGINFAANDDEFYGFDVAANRARFAAASEDEKTAIRAEKQAAYDAEIEAEIA